MQYYEDWDCEPGKTVCVCVYRVPRSHMLKHQLAHNVRVLAKFRKCMRTDLCNRAYIRVGQAKDIGIAL